MPATDSSFVRADRARGFSLMEVVTALSVISFALVALSTLNFGAAALMTQRIPREYVLVLGAVGSLVVGICYAPAAAALRRSGERLTDAMFAKPPADGEDLVQQLDRRAKFEQLLGVDRALFVDLQTAIPILGPLLAGASVLLAG